MSDNESRLVDIEVKIAFYEGQFEELSDVVRELHEKVDALRREVVHLRNELDSGLTGHGDEPPPHY